MIRARLWCWSLCALLAACAGTAERPAGQEPSRLPATLFEEGNAQLKAAALKPLAEQAAVIAGRGENVTHVIGIAANAESRDLAERRAAAVAGYFSLQGIAPARLRYESRIVRRDAAVVFVAAPIIPGRETQAWMPPALRGE